MPDGKPAGVICVNLDPATRRCRIWGQPDYPEVCRRFPAAVDTCGASRVEALVLLGDLEADTRPRSILA